MKFKRVNCTIRFLAESGRPPTFRAVVERVRDDDKTVLAEYSGMVTAELARGATARIRWVRTNAPLAPTPGCPDLHVLIAPSGPFGVQGGTRFSKRLIATLYAIVHPTELTQNHFGDGWLFCLRVGQEPFILQTLRAGVADVGSRVPGVTHLRDKSAVLIGAGAIGSFVAMELARNGCRKIRIVERDQVEPGNSIRWPLGASAWGIPKGEAFLCSRDSISLDWDQQRHNLLLGRAS